MGDIGGARQRYEVLPVRESERRELPTEHARAEEPPPAARRGIARSPERGPR